MSLTFALKEAKKYKSRIDFQKENPYAYRFLCTKKKLFLLDKIFPKKRIKWTLELAIKQAKKYNSRSEFKKGSVGAFNVLKKHENLLNEIFPLIRWTVNSAIKEAKKYNSRSEFMRASNGAYYFLLKSKKGVHALEKVFHKKGRKWDLKLVLKLANEYNDKGETKSKFFKHFPGANAFLRRNKKLHLLDRFFKSKKSENWTINKVLKLAYKFKLKGLSRVEFQRQLGGGYNFLLRRKKQDLLDKIFKKKSLSLKMALSEAREFKRKGKTRQEFRVERSILFRFLHIKKKLYILDNILPYAHINWTIESAIKEAKKYNSRSEFMESGGYSFLKRKKALHLLDEIWPLPISLALIRKTIKLAKCK